MSIERKNPMPRLVKFVLSSIALYLSGCAKTATPGDVYGTWILIVANPPVQMTVTFKPDFTFEENIVETGRTTQSATGTWKLDGDKLQLSRFLWWEGGKMDK